MMVFGSFGSFGAFAEDTLERTQASNPILIDVRTDAEWNDGYIETAIHIPLDKILEKIELVTENKEFPDGSLIVGSPAKAVKELDDKTIANLTRSSKHYVDNFKKFSKELKEIK